MAKLGGAVVSAMADIHLYAKELSYQGRTYLGGVAEAMGNLAKIKNTAKKEKQQNNQDLWLIILFMIQLQDILLEII